MSAGRSLALTAGAATALVLAACGDDGPASSDDQQTRLVVDVRPRGDEAPARRRSVADCSPGRAHSAICRRLRALPHDALAPVAGDAVCTQIYGGPATAVVRGAMRGRPVDTRFSLRNGCEIDRWKRFSWLIGEPPRGSVRMR